MPFASLSDFNKWHKSIQRRYNTVEDRALQRKKAVLNRLHGPPRPNACSAGTKTGADSPPFARCDITTKAPVTLRSPTGVSSSDTAPSAGGLPAHQIFRFLVIIVGPIVASIVAITHHMRYGDELVAIAVGVGWLMIWNLLWWYTFKPMAQRGTTSDMPSKSGSIPPAPTPYPPVRYEWEL